MPLAHNIIDTAHLSRVAYWIYVLCYIHPDWKLAFLQMRRTCYSKRPLARVQSNSCRTPAIHAVQGPWLVRPRPVSLGTAFCSLTIFTNKRKRLISVSTSLLIQRPTHYLRPVPLIPNHDWNWRAEGNYAAPGHRASHFPHKSPFKMQKAADLMKMIPGLPGRRGKIAFVKNAAALVASETQRRR